MQSSDSVHFTGSKSRRMAEFQMASVCIYIPCVVFFSCSLIPGSPLGENHYCGTLCSASDDIFTRNTRVHTVETGFNINMPLSRPVGMTCQFIPFCWVFFLVASCHPLLKLLSQCLGNASGNAVVQRNVALSPAAAARGGSADTKKSPLQPTSPTLESFPVNVQRGCL